MELQEKIYKLSVLADMLDRHEEIFPTVRFDMQEWKRPNTKCDKDVCGTAACALGSAASYPPLQKHGLYLVEGYKPNTYTPKYDVSDRYTSAGYTAGAHFFGITNQDSEYLFMPDNYKKEYPKKRILPKHVAKRVRQLMTELIKQEAV